MALNWSTDGPLDRPHSDPYAIMMRRITALRDILKLDGYLTTLRIDPEQKQLMT